MLHNCPHALGDNSNPIDGHRWSIDAHRKKLRWPSMGFDGPIDGIEWSLSTGTSKNEKYESLEIRCTANYEMKPYYYQDLLSLETSNSFFEGLKKSSML